MAVDVSIRSYYVDEKYYGAGSGGGNLYVYSGTGGTTVVPGTYVKEASIGSGLDWVAGYLVSNASTLLNYNYTYSTTLTTNTTTPIIVGDKTTDKSLYIYYFLTRGEGKRQGDFSILNDGSTLFKSPDYFISNDACTGNIESESIDFSVAYSGNDIIINASVNNAGDVTMQYDTRNFNNDSSVDLSNYYTRTEVSALVTPAQILGKLLTVDGSGSGLDADLWDGYHFADYLNQPVKTISTPTFAAIHCSSVNDNNLISSTVFTSGFAGSGWKIQNGATADATVDNLTVRRALKVYELEIEKIKSGNGSYWFSDGCKIDRAEEESEGTWCFIDDASGKNLVPFDVGDILRCQNWTDTGSRFWQAQCTSVNNLSDPPYFIVDHEEPAYYIGTDIPIAGDDVVRVGSTDVDRRGAVYITSNDDDSPYIDVIYGCASVGGAFTTKVRLGKLDGITDTNGGLSGTQTNYYGLYTNNGHFTGHLYSNTGKIGNWDISTYTLSNLAVGYGIELKSSVTEKYVKVQNTASNYTKLFYDNTNDGSWGLLGVYGGANVFKLSTTSQIGATNFDNKYLWTGTKQTSNTFSTNGITWDSSGRLRTPTVWLDESGNMAVRTHSSGRSLEIKTADSSVMMIYGTQATNDFMAFNMYESGSNQIPQIWMQKAYDEANPYIMYIKPGTINAYRSGATPQFYFSVGFSDLLVHFEGLPTNSAMVNDGDVYNESGVLKIKTAPDAPGGEDPSSYITRAELDASLNQMYNSIVTMFNSYLKEASLGLNFNWVDGRFEPSCG